MPSLNYKKVILGINQAIFRSPIISYTELKYLLCYVNLNGNLIIWACTLDFVQ